MSHLDPSTIYLDASDYDIDPETGLVAFDLSSSELPPYYNPWKELNASLPELLTTSQLGLQINKLPLLNTTSLTTKAHWRRTCVTLGYLTQAYIWEDKVHPRSVVLPCLSAPFLEVCSHLGMKSVLSYAGLCLWNCVPNPAASFTSINKTALLAHLPSIQSYASFTGTASEDAFNLIPVMIESHCAPLIPLLLTTIQSFPPPSFETLSRTL